MCPEQLRRVFARRHTVSLLAVTVVLVLECSTGEEAAFNVSLELQGDCSDQLTLICRHDAVPTDPTWIHNETVEGGELFTTAFRGLTMYSFQNRTEHRVTVNNVAALDGCVIQCAYSINATLIKSNTVWISFVPNGYQPVLSLVNVTTNFSKHLSILTYSFQESCSLYPRCTPYFSVEHTVSPLSVVSNTSSGCTVEYTISNLERCRTYHSTATAVCGNQRGNTVIVGVSVMLSPGHFNITMVSIASEANSSHIDVTYDQYEPDCPGYPTERYTVDIDGVQVANMTADEFQSLTTSHTNSSVTLSLPLTQPLSENATTVNMTKFNTVPTNMSDDKGIIVTEMVTWGTSAVFGLQSQTEPTFFVDSVGAIAGGTCGGVVVLCGGGTVTAVIIIIIIIKKRKQKDQSPQTNPCSETSACAEAGGLELTPTKNEKLVDAGRPLPMLPEDNQPEETESGTAQPLQQYAELEFGDHEMRPTAAPPNQNLDVMYT